LLCEKRGKVLGDHHDELSLRLGILQARGWQGKSEDIPASYAGPLHLHAACLAVGSRKLDRGVVEGELSFIQRSEFDLTGDHK
jgi:hypothetical protein